MMQAARKRRVATAIIAACIFLSASVAHARRSASPPREDPAVDQPAELDLVFNGGLDTRHAGLVVFIPGTKQIRQNPPNFSLAGKIERGNRVIVLTTVGNPQNSQLCPGRPEDCTGRLKGDRVVVPDTGRTDPEADIPGRIAGVLRTLARLHPDAGWDFYLGPDGRPDWRNIIVLGRRRNPG